MLNTPIAAHQALEWGLVNRVVPSVTKDGAFIEGASPEQVKRALAEEDGFAIDLARLDASVGQLCQQLIDCFPECTRYTKQHVNFWKDFAWHQTIGHARDWLAIHYTSWEPLEGMSAFVERRPADYRGLRQRAADGRSSEFRWGPYARTCPACGAGQLPAEHRYCGCCGAPLGDDATTAARGADGQD